MYICMGRDGTESGGAEEVESKDQRPVIHELRALITRQRQSAVAEMAQLIRDRVIPTLASLCDDLTAQQRTRLDAAIIALEQAIAAHALPDVGVREDEGNRLAKLAPAELRVSLLIRQGFGTKQIALIEGISPATVAVHRRSIRRKLGLTHTKRNLRAFLSSTSSSSGDRDADHLVR